MAIDTTTPISTVTINGSEVPLAVTGGGSSGSLYEHSIYLEINDGLLNGYFYFNIISDLSTPYTQSELLNYLSAKTYEGEPMLGVVGRIYDNNASNTVDVLSIGYADTYFKIKFWAGTMPIQTVAQSSITYTIYDVVRTING